MPCQRHRATSKSAFFSLLHCSSVPVHLGLASHPVPRRQSSPLFPVPPGVHVLRRDSPMAIWTPSCPSVLARRITRHGTISSSLGPSRCPSLATPSRARLAGRAGNSRTSSWESRQKRFFHAETVLLPPVVFCGLLGTLWLWKCAMMVLFQNKIIYMPGLPPNARRERIEDYAGQCGGVRWEEKRIRAADGTDLALCVANVLSSGPHHPTSPHAKDAVAADATGPAAAAPAVYILYFQGRSP
jgi:hypothetical protein